MTPSNGQMDATICGKCCKHLAFSAKYVGTHCQPARITGRNTSNTTHAVPSKGFHPCAAPSALQNKVASATPTMAAPTIRSQFRELVSCPFMAASRFSFLLGSTYMSIEGPRNRHFPYFLIAIPRVRVLFSCRRLALKYLVNHKWKIRPRL